MIRIALTGSFGSGKSTVLRFFKKNGVPVISCDAIVKKLLETKKLKEKIAQTFGQDYINEQGKINKKKLAMLVFSTVSARKKLNEIVHPYVFDKMERLLDIYKKKGKMAVIVEIPLLFETRSEKRFDAIITVFAPRRIIKERLKGKYSPEEIEMRLKSQIPINRKINKSDYVIDNSSSHYETWVQAKKIFEEIIRRHSTCQKKLRN